MLPKFTALLVRMMVTVEIVMNYLLQPDARVDSTSNVGCEKTADVILSHEECSMQLGLLIYRL